MQMQQTADTLLDIQEHGDSAGTTPPDAPTAPGSRRARGAGAALLARSILGNRKAALGVVMLAFFVLVAVVGPIIWPGDPSAPFYDGPPMQAPSAAHWFGTDQQSHDIFLQMVYGTRPVLFIGFSIALLATVLAGIGILGGYVGGWVDDALNLLTNVFLVIPAFPLVIVLASWIQVKNDIPLILVITLTSWPWGARVLRSQTLSLRERDFVQAAVVSGEGTWRVVTREILPNMISIVMGNFIGTVIAAVGSAAGLYFLGLGNLSEVNWFTILYWAQQASALQQGAWWTFVIPGCAIAAVGVACALINYGIDEVSNPRLRVEKVKSARKRVASAPSMATAGAGKAAAR